MPQPISSLKKSTKTQSGDDLNGFVKDTAYSVQSTDRQKQRFQTLSKNNPKFQKRNRFGDQFTQINGDNLDISIQDSKGNLITRSLSSDLSNFIAFQTGTVAPTTANFPEDGSWGWYQDTITNYIYLSRNVASQLRQITITTLEGSITAAQHGSLTGAGTFHSFSGITGTITAGQHGNLTSGGPLHNFTVISGSIDDTQHGTRGGGTLHANAGASAGFMSSADKTKLDAATASATASTLALRDASGNLNAVAYESSGTKVVGARNSGWGAMTGASNKATVYDPSTITLVQLAERVSAMQIALTTHGLLGA